MEESLLSPNLRRRSFYTIEHEFSRPSPRLPHITRDYKRFISVNLHEGVGRGPEQMTIEKCDCGSEHFCLEIHDIEEGWIEVWCPDCNSTIYYNGA